MILAIAETNFMLKQQARTVTEVESKRTGRRRGLGVPSPHTDSHQALSRLFTGRPAGAGGGEAGGGAARGRDRGRGSVSCRPSRSRRPESRGRGRVAAAARWCWRDSSLRPPRSAALRSARPRLAAAGSTWAPRPGWRRERGKGGGKVQTSRPLRGHRWRDVVGRAGSAAGVQTPARLVLSVPAPACVLVSWLSEDFNYPSRRDNSFRFDPKADLREAEIVSWKKDRVPSAGVCTCRVWLWFSFPSWRAAQTSNQLSCSLFSSPYPVKKIPITCADDCSQVSLFHPTPPPPPTPPLF